MRKSIIALRGPKNQVDANRPFAVWREYENDLKQRTVSVTTIILTGAECRFACTMCDLWKHTLDEPTPIGALPTQIEWALKQVPKSDWIKLYNASNFFDPHAVPEKDLPVIAALCQDFERVIVENHPRLIRPSILDFGGALNGRLEVAMGLETIDPSSFNRLNKEATIEDYVKACDWFVEHQIDVRTFLMLQPPGMNPKESVDWSLRSTAFAVAHQARHICMIPTRGGNGMMEALADEGNFTPPTARQLEIFLEQALLANHSSVVTVDLWDWAKMVGHCEHCREPRLERLKKMNLHQTFLPQDTYGCGGDLG